VCLPRDAATFFAFGRSTLSTQPPEHRPVCYPICLLVWRPPLIEECPCSFGFFVVLVFSIRLWPFFSIWFADERLPLCPFSVLLFFSVRFCANSDVALPVDVPSPCVICVEFQTTCAGVSRLGQAPSWSELGLLSSSLFSCPGSHAPRCAPEDDSPSDYPFFSFCKSLIHDRQISYATIRGRSLFVNLVGRRFWVLLLVENCRSFLRSVL